MVTEQEIKLAKMLKQKRDDVDYIATILQLCRNKNKTDDLIKFIETYVDANSDEVFKFAIMVTVKEA